MIDAIQTAVRPLVTVMLTACFCYGFVTDKVSAEAFIGVVGVVVTFWFNQRQQDKNGVTPKP